MGAAISNELKNELPLFLVVLNGSFMFAADLLKEVNIPCEVSFVKLSSYSGTSSTGTVNELIGLKENISGRTVVIVEDIVDSGLTIKRLCDALGKKKAGRILIVTALFKEECYKENVRIDYIGFKIPSDFVVGYGLDYDGLGRNLKDIHILA